VEIVNVNLPRDKKIRKDQRMTVLAVDKFNGIKIKGRTVRVDHTSNYQAPWESEAVDDMTRGSRGRTVGPIQLHQVLLKSLRMKMSNSQKSERKRKMRRLNTRSKLGFHPALCPSEARE
jgi:RNA-binding motif X-linked protein 2